MGDGTNVTSAVSRDTARTWPAELPMSLAARQIRSYSRWGPFALGLCSHNTHGIADAQSACTAVAGRRLRRRQRLERRDCWTPRTRAERNHGRWSTPPCSGNIAGVFAGDLPATTTLWNNRQANRRVPTEEPAGDPGEMAEHHGSRGLSNQPEDHDADGISALVAGLRQGSPTATEEPQTDPRAGRQAGSY